MGEGDGQSDYIRRAVREGFGKGFWGFLAFAVITGTACYTVLGPEAFHEAVARDTDLLLKTIPRVVAAVSVAGLVWALLPREKLIRLVGSESGLKGLVIATLGGVVTPGGPASAFSLLAVLGSGGADRGAMVAYVTSWSMLGLQRILVWDVPFMGADFSVLRFCVCLPLPIIAGLIARRVPFELSLRNDDRVPESRS